MSVNALYNNFDSEVPITMFGSIDMGGESTEIAFQTSGNIPANYSFTDNIQIQFSFLLIPWLANLSTELTTRFTFKVTMAWELTRRDTLLTNLSIWHLLELVITILEFVFVMLMFYRPRFRPLPPPRLFAKRNYNGERPTCKLYFARS